MEDEHVEEVQREEYVPEDEEENLVVDPSSCPQFADIFLFFKRFSAYLSLPDVSLAQLERFFRYGSLEEFDDPITDLHYRLFTNIIRRPADKENWIFVASKLAYTNNYIEGTFDYEDFDITQKLQLLKFLCDAQFTRNNSFKNQMSKLLEEDRDAWWREKPVGLDRKGLRYWLLQDSVYDIRLYSEDKYLEYPFDHPKWNLICTSEVQLKAFIEQLESSTAGAVADKEKKEKEKEEEEEEDKESEDSSGSHDNSQSASSSGGVKRRRRRSKRRNRKTSRTGTKKDKKNEEVKGGCVVCKKDTFYSKMLLCDKCDSECHTYCQYPIVWTIPDGEWFCPNCRELQLIEDLKKLHFELIEGLYLCEKRMEEEQRKIKRLQRGGVLVQNIISTECVADETDAPRRSGRSKKHVNYAQLNELDIHTLPPARSSSRSVHSRTSRHFNHTIPSTGYYTTRRTRLLLGQKHEERLSPTPAGDPPPLIKGEGKEEEERFCHLEVMTVMEQQSVQQSGVTDSPASPILCSFPLVGLNVSAQQPDQELTSSSTTTVTHQKPINDKTGDATSAVTRGDTHSFPNAITTVEPTSLYPSTTTACIPLDSASHSHRQPPPNTTTTGMTVYSSTTQMPVQGIACSSVVPQAVLTVTRATPVATPAIACPPVQAISQSMQVINPPSFAMQGGLAHSFSSLYASYKHLFPSSNPFSYEGANSSGSYPTSVHGHFASTDTLSIHAEDSFASIGKGAVSNQSASATDDLPPTRQEALQNEEARTDSNAIMPLMSHSHGRPCNENDPTTTQV